MTSSRSLFTGFLCLFYCANCFNHNLSPSRLENKNGPIVKKSYLRVYCSPAEKDISKYEARSKLLEAVLQSDRAKQIQSDLLNDKLSNQLSDLSSKYNVIEKRNNGIVIELEKVEYELQLSVKNSKAMVIDLEDEQAERKELTAAIEKYKKRLSLLENAYQESQVITKEIDQEEL